MYNSPKFFDLNGTHVGMVFKSGSSAIARAIKLHLEPNWRIVTTSGDDVSAEHPAWKAAGWQAGVPHIESPTNPIIPVRNPVERFRSACAQEGKTAEDALNGLEDGSLFSNHFRKTSDWLIVDSRLCKFPDHIDFIASELGLDSIPPVNESETNNGPKPDLTPEQLARVEAYYADDIALFNSIVEAGQTYSVPVPPEPVEPVPQEIANWRARAILEVEGLLLQVDTLIDALVGPEGVAVKAAWIYGAPLQRGGATVQAIAAQLGLTDEQVDDLFRSGAALTV